MAAERGKLTLVGLGLYDEEGITVRGMKELENADFVFAESYTSCLTPGSIERLAGRTGKSIQQVSRTDVEDAGLILEKALGNRVVLVVPGDPMTATTHVDLRLRATRKGIDTTIVNGVSALTAVPGLLGLQHYKFGRTTTVPFPAEGYSPTSPYEVVRDNLGRGLHTLVLLDIDSENSHYMTANQGLNLLTNMEERIGAGILSDRTLVCVVARAGHPDTSVRAGPLGMISGEDFGPPLHTLVVPGRLHFMEEEALRTFARWSSPNDQNDLDLKGDGRP